MQHHNPKHFMAAQICHKGGKLELKEQQWREPKRNEVIVKVMACGVSSRDCITQDQLLGGISYPRTPGHEFIGEVVACGNGEMDLKTGHMVGGSWHGGHCMMCEPCRAGDFACCTMKSIHGVTRDGSMAEYICMRAEACVMVPKDCDPAEMCAMMCAGSTIFTSLKNMSLGAGDLVGIHAAGGMGKLACDLSRCMGYRTVLIGEGDQLKREMSLKPHEFIDCTKGDVAEQLMQMGGAKVILCCLPARKHLPPFVEGLQHNGQLVLTAMGHESRVELPMAPMLMKRLSIVGFPSPTPLQVEDCLRFVKMHDIRVDTRKFSLKECNKAWECAMKPDEMRKPVLMMD